MEGAMSENIAAEELAAFIEQACLQPDAVLADIDAACDEALARKFRGVVVPSGAVSHTKRRLLDTGVRVVCVVGYPNGTEAPDIKAHEAMRCAAMGADEIDYVISIGAAKEGDLRYIREEGVAIMRQTRGKLVKAILEVGYLNEQQTYNTARALAEAGMHYVKTCTGFGPGVCTADVVKLLARAVAGRALIKASGGIKEKWQAIEMLEAGAAVIGTSHGPAICSG
jgi:deoxyribose-phosphate aldolase